MAIVANRPGVGIRAWLVDSGEPRSAPTYRADLVTSLLGVWFGVGLFLDAWAHSNVPELESFFTPWHGVFYSGFTATAIWILWLVWRNLAAGRRGLAAIPLGYGLAVIALPVFAAGGVADFIWHTLLGIEQNITILFSPSHLVLITSMIVILTAPLRSAWSNPTTGTAPSFRRLLPGLLGLAFAASLILLFMSYGNPLQWGGIHIVTAFSNQEGDAGGAQLAISIVAANLLLLAPILLLARRWQVPPGFATLLYAVCAIVSGALTAFSNLATLAAIVVAGVLVDLLLLWLRPAAERRTTFIGFAMLAPFVTWTVYLGFASVSVGRLPSIVELWTGVPIVAALHGLLLAVLCVPGVVAGQRPVVRT
ncbi:hypothetical protein [Actinopolymorpha alba]|uniref:hypothetical protein n=1 Tax=Actinopolymorpha alba TaxID=533267 RepID=UPI00036191C6|nr:hypothetical protein [Actinopolymorpha alba]